MAFIKIQKLKYKNNSIVSGSASICDTIYGKFGTYHAKHTVRENLGKIIFLSDDKKSGIFLSPSRGLVEYDSVKDTFSEIETDDSRVSNTRLIQLPKVHTVFGDVYFLLDFCQQIGIINILKNTFVKTKDYERTLCHLLHGILKNGSKITCDNFISKSFASIIFKDIPIASLKSDIYFFQLLGNDDVKITFFQNFVSMMRKSNPNFGKGCYVDSTPLPNDIKDNPFNALCCHGVSSSEIMMRLILVLDEETGLPTWFDIIPGNVLDISTVMTTVNDVASSIGIEIESLVLDAGYISKNLLETFYVGTEKTIIGRMPARKGFPFKELYWEVKGLISKGKYKFKRNGNIYFGKKKEIEIFGHKQYAYVYIDQYAALKRFSDYLVDHSKEYEQMKDKDKDWMTVKFGYFILISNIDTSPEDLLSQYFCRTNIETVFKTSKEYLSLLPLAKWTDQTIRGKILSDIIETIILLQLRHKTVKSNVSVNEILGKLQSLMCFSEKNNIIVETPNKKTKEYYNIIGCNIPACINIPEYIDSIIK